MAIVNKKKFSVDINGVPTEFAAMRPNMTVATQAQLVHAKAFRDAIQAGAIVRASLDSILRGQNLWDDEKSKEYDACIATLLNGEMKLKKGGMKLTDARSVAIDMRVARYRMQALSSSRNQLDSTTAEYFAENAKFNYLVAMCTVYADTGKPYFESDEHYQSLVNDPVKNPAADALASILYELEDGYDAKLPENKFLLKFKFCNEKLHLVDKQGNMVDSRGRRVDSQDRLIDDGGRLIDADGNLLTEDGEYDVETSAFLDDEGLPVDDNGETIAVAKEVEVAAEEPEVVAEVPEVVTEVPPQAEEPAAV